MTKSRSKASPVRVEGPLEPLARGFKEELIGLGYTPLSAANQLRVMAHLSRWLEARRLDPKELMPDRIEEFLSDRRGAGYTCWRSRRGLAPLLAYLRRVGAVHEPAPTVPVGTLEVTVADFERYLLVERGLAPTTVTRCTAVARRFLSWMAARHGDLDLGGLRAEDVHAFVLDECPSKSVRGAKEVVTGLRSFLRFLHLCGQTSNALAPAVPAVAGWRHQGVPQHLGRSEVARLLSSCDRRRGVGRRDFAILTLLWRLGLRAGEVAALRLDDVDWRAGEVVVHGKGASVERLPLPADVGEALVGYLCRGRPTCSTPELFVRARAPFGPMTRGSVSTVVRDAGLRAGMGALGAHRLRHSCATELLCSGASLEAVAQVLRHRDLSTTAIYAKVDRTALEALAHPWPGSR